MIEQNKDKKIIDLTHLVNAEISVFPYTKAPQLAFTHRVEKDGFSEMEFILNSHSGTHIDAPYHMLNHSATIDQFSPEKFIGQGLVIDCRYVRGGEINIEQLRPYDKKLSEISFVLLCTGWSNKWKTDDYIKEYPYLSEISAKWISGFAIKGIGVDTISVDEINSPDYPVHKIFLEKEIILIENMANLELLIEKEFQLICLPLKVDGADACPVRAVAVVGD